MPADYLLSATQPLTLAALAPLLAGRATVRLSEDARARMQASSTYLQQRLENEPDRLLSGFGDGVVGEASGHLTAASPPPPAQRLLAQRLLAHAAGTGSEVPAELVRLMLLLKAQSLSLGYSGAAPATVQRLLDLYNREMYPVVYEQGAVGAAGDVTPLAHLCLPLLGLGEVNYQGYRLAAADALSLFSWAPLALPAAEVPALLSGTPFTLAYAVDAALRAERLSRAADVIGAMSVEAYGGGNATFDERLHRLRPHAGQLVVARRLRELLAGPARPAHASSADASPEPYSFRCMPQVHGASRDALAYVSQVLDIECASATEQTAVFPADDLLLSGGNFHGQPLALALGQLTAAVAVLGSISERRTRQLLSGGRRGLAPLPTDEAGPGADWLVAQQTAAGIGHQNQQLCAAVSGAAAGSNGRGPADFASLSAQAAAPARQVVGNVEQMLGIELLIAARALARRPAHRSEVSEVLETVLAAFDGQLPPGGPARAPYLEVQAAAGFVRRFEWQ